GAFGGGADLGEVVAGVLRGGEPEVGEVGVADDDAEHVVEIVGDAAGEAAEGFHLVGLAQAFFEGHAFGDVAHAGEQAVFAADFGAAQDDLGPEGGAVGAAGVPGEGVGGAGERGPDVGAGVVFGVAGFAGAE